MNPSMKRNILFMAVLAIMAVSAQSQAPVLRGGPTNQFCKTAIEKEMCTKQVKGATTWHNAVKNAIESTAELNAGFQKLLPEVIKAIRGPSKAIIAKTCKDDFDNLSSNIKDSIKFFAENDTQSVSTYLSSCGIVDCQEAFISSESEMPPSVAKAFDVLHWYIDNCLAVTNQN